MDRTGYGYICVVVVMTALYLLAGKISQLDYSIFDKKTNPLRQLYPMADMLWRGWHSITGSKPADRNLERNIRELIYKKIAVATGVVFLAGVFGGLIFILEIQSDGQADIIDRPQTGEASTEVAVTARKAGEDTEYNVGITVQPKQLTEEEAFENFARAQEEMEQIIVGENESLDHVTKNLNLVTQMPEYGMSLSWQTDRYHLLTSDGQVKNTEMNNTDPAIPVGLTVVMSCGQYEKELQLTVQIYPPDRTEEQQFEKELEDSIRQEEQDSVTEDQLKLPDQINGAKLSYSSKKENLESMIAVLGIVGAFVGVLGVEIQRKKDIQSRKEKLQSEYAEMVSKMTLLIGAGMTIRKAWTKIVRDYQHQKSSRNAAFRECYEEMIYTLNQIESGKSEAQAYIEFGKRCERKEYMKFSSLLEQNLKKGNKSLIRLLENESDDAFLQRINLARKQGEEAGTKLLLPMGLMLIIVMVIVVIPAFMSFGI